MTKHDRERAKGRWRERAWQKGRELWHALICANRSSLRKQAGFADSQKAPSAIYPSLSITCYYSSGPLPLLHHWYLHNNYARQSRSITEIYIDASMPHTLEDAAALFNYDTFQFCFFKIQTYICNVLLDSINQAEHRKAHKQT